MDDSFSDEMCGQCMQVRSTPCLMAQRSKLHAYNIYSLVRLKHYDLNDGLNTLNSSVLSFKKLQNDVTPDGTQTQLFMDTKLNVTFVL